MSSLSAGVPMITGGDERLRTQRGNNNPYNLDSPAMWLDWTPAATGDAFAAFATQAYAFRHAHRALRPSAHWREPGNAKGTEVTWLRADGQPADGGYLDSPGQHFIAWSLDGTSLGDDAKAILVGFNRSGASITMTLPAPPKGTTWSLVADTTEAAEAWGNWRAPGAAQPMASTIYALGRRAVAVFTAK